MSQPFLPQPRGEQTELSDQPEPLDVAQQFAEATSYTVRDELAELVRADLLSPRRGRPAATSRGGAR